MPIPTQKEVTKLKFQEVVAPYDKYVNDNVMNSPKIKAKALPRTDNLDVAS